MDATTLLNGVTSTGAGDAVQAHGRATTFQADIAGDGAVTATVEIQGSNTGTAWVPIASMSLDDTDSDIAGFSEPALAWKYVRANLTAVTGTDATVTVTMGS